MPLIESRLSRTSRPSRAGEIRTTRHGSLAVRCKILKCHRYDIGIDFMSSGEYYSRRNRIGDRYLSMVNIIHIS